MIENDPLVSIIITSFNREQWIEKAILSAMEQDYNNIEIIISDNKSTDNSDALIKKYCSDKRIRYWQNETNIGMLPNFRKATGLAKGLFLTYLSSDDYFVNKSFISEAVSIMKKYQNVVVFSAISKNYQLNANKEEHNTAYDFKVSNGLLNKVVSGKTVFSIFQYSHIMNFGGSVFYKESLENLNVFRDSNTTYADLQAALLLALRGDFYFSDKVSYIQTFHNQNASWAYADADKSLLNLNFAEIPFVEAEKINFLEENDLRTWLYNIIRPFIFSSMVSLFKSNKTEYQKFIGYVSKKYPGILSDIMRDKKMRAFKLVYSNKALRFLYDKFKVI